MIKNERQYRITKIQLAEFDATLAQIEQEPAAALPQLLQRVQADAIRSRRADLQAAVDDYETLQQHRPSVIEARSLDELPRALTRTRIALGPSQKGLGAWVAEDWAEGQELA